MRLKRMVDEIKIVTGLASVVPSSSTPDRVSLKKYDGFLAVITVKNATTVTGSAITLKQSTTVAGGSEKALAFDKVWQNEDTASAGGDVLAETAVTSDTFTTDGTNSKDLKYVIDVKTESLDVNNGFDVVRVGTGNATAATVNVEYFLYNGRYKPVQADSVITD